MKILAIEKEISGNSNNDYLPHMKTEALRVWELYESEVIREIYFDKIMHNAVIIMECKDIEEARANLETLPLVKEGLITFDYFALEPYTGFSRLFEQKE